MYSLNGPIKARLRGSPEMKDFNQPGNLRAKHGTILILYNIAPFAIAIDSEAIVVGSCGSPLALHFHDIRTTCTFQSLKTFSNAADEFFGQ